MEMDSDESHPLPHQIILSRLPVKSLLRSKLVCKEWCHSIYTPQFTKLHLSQSQLTTTHHVALLESRNPPSSIALRSIESHSDELVIEIHNSFKYLYPNSKIISSCNGLLLIALSHKTFIVWNPSTFNTSIWVVLLIFSVSFSFWALM
ncbi:putative F-box/kelch-repeat protein At3g17570 [Camellia sinensis]|uniref:putative F-box/kelch-repeat protein At3g17570 n=1 Tax=Camellia sinensis TaxID=4442 RepID=UPI0010364594|nr:putative F-box/kelch-repeat protein At3g17570 [Camellia sinensis]